MFKTTPTPPVEDMIVIHSLSIVLLLSVIRGEFPDALHRFSYWGAMRFVVMIAGLCELAKNPTAKAIAERLGGVSHDSLTRFLNDVSWTASTLMMVLFDFAIVQCGAIPPNSRLILDDVMIAKPYSKAAAGVYLDWDYVNRKHEFCIRLVVLMWTNGVIHIPVAFAMWHKKDSVWLAERSRRYRTKNELARCLIHSVTRRGLSAEYITFDSWYTSKDNLNFLQRLGWTYPAADKHDRIFNRPDLSQTCKKWAASYKTGQLNYYRNRSFRAKSITGYLNGLKHDQQLTIVPKYRARTYFAEMAELEGKTDPKKTAKKTKKKRDPNLYIVTNNLAATTCENIDAYRSRWSIEVMFRELKQNLGLGACQHHTVEAMTRHFALCFFAYVCMQRLREDLVKKTPNHKNAFLTLGDVKKHLQEHGFMKQSENQSSGQPCRTKHQPMSRGLLTSIMKPENPVMIRLLEDSIQKPVEN